MTPIRTYTNWNSRPSDQMHSIEPFRKYFIICEGANTETWYFQHLIDQRKELGIHHTIDLILLEKTGEDKDISYPMKLIEFADRQKKSSEITFDAKRDRMIVIFDADIFEEKVENYDEVIKKGEERNLLGVTNPSFELFLLLHIEDSFETIIKPHLSEILKNEKDGNQRYIYTLLLKQTDINSKKNPDIGKLASNVKTAIQQEKALNQDIHHCKGHVTSNIGKIIDTICEDNGKL